MRGVPPHGVEGESDQREIDPVDEDRQRFCVALPEQLSREWDESSPYQKVNVEPEVNPVRSLRMPEGDVVPVPEQAEDDEAEDVGPEFGEEHQEERGVAASLDHGVFYVEDEERHGDGEYSVGQSFDPFGIEEVPVQELPQKIVSVGRLHNV